MITNTELSNIKRIKDALLRGEHLTTYTGNKLGHTVDFRKRISELRKAGWLIQDLWVTAEDGRRFKEYFL